MVNFRAQGARYLFRRNLFWFFIRLLHLKLIIMSRSVLLESSIKNNGTISVISPLISKYEHVIFT